MRIGDLRYPAAKAPNSLAAASAAVTAGHSELLLTPIIALDRKKQKQLFLGSTTEKGQSVLLTAPFTDVRHPDLPQQY